MASDRRANPRFPLILAVQFVGADAVLDYTENLSASGLFIRTDREFRVGERLTLVVSFPQLLEPLELQVEVVRVRGAAKEGPGGVAVRVPHDRKDDLARLDEVARRIGAPRVGEPDVRVLLAEDNALVASMYGAALRRLSDDEGLSSISIEVASDGAVAFDRLMRSPAIDILVTDIFMPILSGISLVEKIRAESSIAQLPVVAITSGGQRERERLARLGVTLFLRKPVSYRDVAGAIRTLIGSRSSRGLPEQPLPAKAPGGAAASQGLTQDRDVSTDPPDAIPASRR